MYSLFITSAMAFNCGESSPPEPPKVEVDGFTVSVNSAWFQRNVTPFPGIPDAMVSVDLNVALKDPGRRKVWQVMPTAKTTPSTNMRWNASVTRRKQFSSPYPGRSGGPVYLDAPLHFERPSRGDTGVEPVTARFVSGWGNGGSPTKLERFEGEIACFDVAECEFRFEGPDLSVGGVRRQNGVQARLFCFDLDPLDEMMIIGVRCSDERQKGASEQTGINPLLYSNREALTLETLKRSSIQLKTALEMEDGSRIDAVPIVSGSYPICTIKASTPCKGKKPKAFVLSLSGAVGEQKRIPFRLENIELQEGRVRTGLQPSARPISPQVLQPNR